MSKKEISAGVVHKMPTDLRQILTSRSVILTIWETLTPLARNEWLCWIESAKKQDTKNRRIERLAEDLQKGKRRPCCWAGCAHRKK